MAKTPKNPIDKPNLHLASSSDLLPPNTLIPPTTSKPKVTKLPAATFSPEALCRLVNEVTEQRKLIAELMAGKSAKPAKRKVPTSADNDTLAIKIFTKAGFTDIQPRVNLLTFRKWVELGRRPIEKSKALKVNNLRLWHITQTRIMTKAELKALKEQAAAATVRREGSPNLELQ